MNKARELHISKCKAEFREFAENHKFLLRHVKKETYPKVALNWLSRAKYLLDRIKDGDYVDQTDRVVMATEARILRENAKALCKVRVIGTIIIFYDEEGLRVGFAKVHAPDVYNRHIGICRAIKDSYGEVDRAIPNGLQGPMTKMMEFAESDRGQEILRRGDAWEGDTDVFVEDQDGEA
jgi:hypothetical protein